MRTVCLFIPKHVYLVSRFIDKEFESYLVQVTWVKDGMAVRKAEERKPLVADKIESKKEGVHGVSSYQSETRLLIPKPKRANEMVTIKWGTPAVESPPPSKPQPQKVVPWSKQPTKKVSKHRGKKFLIQLTISAALFGVTWLVYQPTPLSTAQNKAFVSEVMTRDFNFAGTAEWIKNVAGIDTNVLPVFTTKKKPPSDKQVITWGTPIKGKIMLPYNEERKGIVVKTTKGAPIGAAADGLVSYIGKKDGLGQVIIIRHASGKETWYGYAQHTKVKEKEWVRKGQPIAEGTEREGTYFMYFAMLDNNRYVDPTGVIRFE